MTYQVAVCGSRNCTEAESAAAYRVGELPADQGVTILCGGGSGLMAAVATRGL